MEHHTKIQAILIASLGVSSCQNDVRPGRDGETWGTPGDFTTGTTDDTSHGTEGTSSLDAGSDASVTSVEPTGETGETGTSTSSGSTAEESTGLLPEPCEVFEPEVVYVPPEIVFVLDQSGSMSGASWDHDQNPATAKVTRWHSLHNVVERIVTTFEHKVDFGAKLFPTADGCGVVPGLEVEPAPANAAAIMAALPPTSVTLTGLTPPEQGIAAAADWSQLQPAAGSRAFVLIMDGDVHPSCGTPNGLITRLQSTHKQRGIPTYLVGVDIEPGYYSAMNSYAKAGGVPRPSAPLFYDATHQQQLLDAIENIVDDVGVCTLELGSPPKVPSLTRVVVDGVEWNEVGDCQTESGWIWSNPHSQLTLCGGACDAFELTMAAKVEYYCIPG